MSTSNVPTTAPVVGAQSKEGAVLYAIRRAERGIRMTDIATTAGCAQITARRHVRTLMDRGLVYRRCESGQRPKREDGTRRAGRWCFEYEAVAGAPASVR